MTKIDYALHNHFFSCNVLKAERQRQMRDKYMSDKIIIRNGFSCRVSAVKKSNGHSPLRAIAYIMARKMTNEITGDEHNFSNKSGVISTGFLMPNGVETNMNEEEFYSHLENNSHGSTNILAYSSIMALPSELDTENQQKLVADFCEYFTDTYKTAISFAIHEPDNLMRKKAKLAEIEKYNLPVSDDEIQHQIQNCHVHLVMPYCKIETLTEQDLKAKRKKKSHGDSFKLGSQVKDFNPIKFGSEIKKEKPDLMNTSQNFIQFMREEWCNFTNTALEKSNRIERYTHKSYKDLGLQISATIHEGEMVKSRVARGKKMKVHDYNLKQKAKQQTEQDYVDFINRPIPKELAYKILNGGKLAEKELLESLKPQPKTELEQAQDLLRKLDKAQQLLEDQTPSSSLREKLERMKNKDTIPGQEASAESLSQKLERLKQKKDETPKPTTEPTRDIDNSNSNSNSNDFPF